jgi:hypothetical protein
MLRPEDETRLLRALNLPINRHMNKFFEFTQSRTDGVITVTVLKRLYSNFLKNVDQTVTYKQRDTSTPIDCVRSKFVRNRLIVAGTPFVLKVSITSVIGTESSKGELIPLRRKDIEMCNSNDIPHLSITESKDMITSR